MSSQERSYYRASEIVDHVLGRNRTGKESTDWRCMWQVCPNELPKDMPTMALEVWMKAGDQRLHLIQIHVDCDRRDSEDWFNYAEGWTYFVQQITPALP